MTISGSSLGLQSVINSIDVYAQVVEAPVIVHGEVGTQFHSSAIRLKLDVDLVDLHPDTTALVSALSTALGAGFSVQADATVGQLQLYVEVARGQGVITQIDILANTVTVQATPGVADVYLGTIPDALFFNRAYLLNPATDVTFGSVGSLSIQVTDTLTGITTVSSAGIDAMSTALGEAPLATDLLFAGPFPETQTVGTSSAFIANLVSQLAADTTIQLSGSLGALLDPLVNTVILPPLQTIVTDALTPVLSTTLTSVVDPQLELLGIGLGEMDVTVLGMHGYPPQAVNDSVSTLEDTSVVISVLANDTDNDGDPLAISAVTQPANGSVAVNADGTLTYTPVANFNGSDSFSYTITDGQGGTSTATVAVAVAAVNDAPLAAGDSITVAEDGTATVPVLSNDSDVDGDALTISGVTQGAHGSVVINADGTVSYTPDPNFNGNDSFSYTVSDGNGATDSASVSVTITAVNDAPQANPDAPTTVEDTPLTVDVLANDADIDGDALTITSITQGSHGSVVINADGTVSYTPNQNFNGTDAFTYTVSDGQGGSSTATVSVTITAVNDAPQAIADSPSTTEDTPLTINVLSNDSDVDGDALTITEVTQGAHGVVTINADGTLAIPQKRTFMAPILSAIRSVTATAPPVPRRFL